MLSFPRWALFRCASCAATQEYLQIKSDPGKALLAGQPLVVIQTQQAPMQQAEVPVAVSLLEHGLRDAA